MDKYLALCADFIIAGAFSETARKQDWPNRKAIIFLKIFIALEVLFWWG